MALVGTVFETSCATYTVEALLGEGGSGRVLAVVDDAGTSTRGPKFALGSACGLD